MNDCKVRIPLAGKGANRLIEKDNKVFVTDYFSGSLSVVDFLTPVKEQFVRTVRLGNEPEMNEIRKGELLFADAGMCYQHWQSCRSCHPDGRSDGLNWDLANDGLGNPKNTKSMLYSHMTPPCMITGIRADAEIAVRAGIRNIQLAQRPEEDAVCIDKYLSSLSPLPSPYLINGKLSPKAEKGKAVYEKAECNRCHNGTYLTDMQLYDVGVGTGNDTGVRFDTPTLKEIWRTAPYLYDGRAKTIKEVLTIYNKDDKHGTTSGLSEEEIEALEQYVLSL
jgi:cytochrome c peroxidase